MLHPAPLAILPFLLSTTWAIALSTFHSHPPMRPLPAPATRPADAGPARYVDPARGDDKSDGSERRPWRTLAHATRQLGPGDTLYLRGGTYYESLTLALAGTPERPITLRSFPGELAIIDGGLREFAEAPQTAWEPVDPASSAPHEYRSTKTYPDLVRPGDDRTLLMGNFADSMVPLHAYRNLIDFRATNPYWIVDHKLSTETGIYCGPGLWFDQQTRRIHVRLDHLNLKSFTAEGRNYRGQTDPRKLALVIAPQRSPLRLDRSKHLRLQDLVLRGSAGRTLDVAHCQNVVFDNLMIYGGSPAVFIQGATDLRFLRCAVRGLSAPWSSRASHKYRGVSPYLLIIDGKAPQTRRIEMAHCEFTDNHDGLILGTASDIDFHHNLVDNFDDDGLYLTLSRDAVPQNIRIHQNYLARTLTMFSFAQSDGGPRKNPVGPGVFICRNIVDFRAGTLGWPPKSAEQDAATRFADHCRAGRPVGDHGSPTWEPMFIYHNTIICAEKAFRDYYGLGLGGHTEGTRRRLFNNIFVQIDAAPGLVFPPAQDDLEADGNLHWSPAAGAPQTSADFFASLQKSKPFLARQKTALPAWCKNDQYGNPGFLGFSANWPDRLDLRLSLQSPALDAGVTLPADWPDPLRAVDQGAPDLGALPRDAPPLQTGRQ